MFVLSMFNLFFRIKNSWELALLKAIDIITKVVLHIKSESKNFISKKFYGQRGTKLEKVKSYWKLAKPLSDSARPGKLPFKHITSSKKKTRKNLEQNMALFCRKSEFKSGNEWLFLK